MGAAAGVYSLPAVNLLLRQVLQTEDMFPAELPRKSLFTAIAPKIIQKQVVCESQDLNPENLSQPNH